MQSIYGFKVSFRLNTTHLLKYTLRNMACEHYKNNCDL